MPTHVHGTAPRLRVLPNRWIRCLCAAALSQAVAVDAIYAASAIEPSPGNQKLLRSTDLSPSGALTRTVDVIAPPNHGNEPKIGLSFHSSRGNGLVGVGWTLA